METNATARVNLATTAPDVYRALHELDRRCRERAVESGLPPALLELVRIRASQLNGCAFCLQLHTTDAAEGGESLNRLAIVSAWRETDAFDEMERAALLLTEALTRIDDHALGDEAHRLAVDALTPEQIAAVSWTAIAINAFNRVAITSKYSVGAK